MSVSPTDARITATTELRAGATEFLAVCGFVLLGGAVILQTRNVDAGVGLLEVALAHGMAFAVLLRVLGMPGGYANPAITLALLVIGRLAPLRAAVCIAGQFLGAIVGVLVLRLTFPSALWESARGTRQLVSLDVSTGQAFALEAIATGLLMLAVMRNADATRPRASSAAVDCGVVITAAMLAIAPLTGGSLNPARSLGAMIVSTAFEGLALYLCAPIVGAVVGAYVARALLPPVASPADDADRADT